MKLRYFALLLISITGFAVSAQQLQLYDNTNYKAIYVKQACDLIQNTPNLVLLDVQMPEMDGYEATALLRAEGYRGPIIALTAHAMAGDRERCISAGCDDFVPKPYSPRQLLAKIRQYLP